MLQQQSVRNRLLAKLSPEDFDLIGPHLEEVDCPLREFLIEANALIERVYFPEDIIASVLAKAGEGRIEVGMIGREGLVGAPIVLGVGRIPHDFMVQAEGKALALPADALRSAMERSSTLRDLLTRYAHVFGVQTASTAYANACLPMEGRLARWVLMTEDRLGPVELPFTHDFLSMMLGVRRPSVTIAVHVLEGNGLIRAKRGRITVLDRERLEDLADSAYGLAEAEYASVIGEA